MRTDIKSHSTAAQTLVPAARTATATGAGVDLAGYDAALVVIDVGAVVSGAFSFEVQHSDDDGVADPYTAVADADLDGAEPGTITASTITRIGYLGRKRYLRVVATDTAAGDATFGVSITRGKPRTLPAT